MTIEAVIAILLPLILYVVLEKRKGLKVAIASSLISATLLVIYIVLRYDFNDYLLWIEYALLMILGLVTLKVEDARFFKFQPCLISTLLGGYVLVTFVMGEPVLVRYLPLMEKMIENPQYLKILQSETFQTVLRTYTWQIGILLVFHGALMFYAATKKSTQFWMWARLSIYPAAALLSFIAGLSA